MKLKILATTLDLSNKEYQRQARRLSHKSYWRSLLLIPLCIATPAQAQSETSRSNAQIAQTPPTAQQVLAACVENRAETLPIPFTDVSPDHWAFKSVMTMHYCGAFRQATPPALIQRLTEEQNRLLPQAERQPQPNLP